MICSLSLKSLHQYYLSKNKSHSCEVPLERHPLTPEICLDVQFWSKFSRVVSDSDFCPALNIQINRARGEKGSGLELYQGIINRI